MLALLALIAVQAEEVSRQIFVWSLENYLWLFDFVGHYKTIVSH